MNIRNLLQDARASVAKAADADCVCADGVQRCKYCRPHRALIERIDEALAGSQVETPAPAWDSVVIGRRMERPIADFERGCTMYLLDEQGKASPDNSLIGLLCDAIRLAREYTDSNRVPSETSAPTAINAEGSELMAEFFNRMSIKELNSVPANIVGRLSTFMVANGYRLIFNQWYLQFPPDSQVNGPGEPK